MMLIFFGSLLCAGTFFCMVLFMRPKKSQSLLSRVALGGAGRRELRNYVADSRSKRLSSWARRATMSKKRLAQIDLELPDVIDLLWVGITSGANLYSAITHIQPRLTGIFAAEFGRLLQALQMGSTLDVELQRMAERLPSRQFQEFCHRILWSLERGTPLVSVLADQAAAARGELRNMLSRLAGRNETRMLIPLVFLILPVTVLFATYPSLQLLNLSYL